jgi:hypothetical protein
MIGHFHCYIMDSLSASRHFHVGSAALGEPLLHHLESKEAQQSQPGFCSVAEKNGLV